MELTNTFTVGQPVDRAWAVITDLERVAPCVPGAALLGVEGENYRGAVKIKVGAVVAQYEGVARFAQRDEEKHHIVLRAEARDVRGQGNAAATIDVQLRPQGEGTEVVVVTDLELAGRVAQFGRGIIADVSSKLIGEFARSLEEEMDREDPTPAAGQPNWSPAGGAEATAVRSSARSSRSIDDVEPVDLMSAGGGVVRALAKQNLPVLLGALGVLLGWLLGRAGRAARLGSTPNAPTGRAGQVVLQLVLPTSVPASTNETKGAS